MMSGVRASSIRIESTSSTIANAWLRWTVPSRLDGHVVAQVVEAELGVRPVRDVGGVRLAPLGERHHVLDGADASAELLVDRPRPLGVALREVVVDGHEVDALARERVQVQRLHGDEGLSLAGLHLGDVALVEDDPAHQLDVEEPDSERALERLAHRGVGLEDDVLERLPVVEPLLELDGLRGELVVGQRLELGLEGSDVLGARLELLEPAALAHAEDALELAERLGRHGSRVPRGPVRLQRWLRPGGRSPLRYPIAWRGVSVAAVDAAGISAISVFADLDEQQRDCVAGACRDLEVDAGTTLAEEGEFGYAMFAVTAGRRTCSRTASTCGRSARETCSARSRCSSAASGPRPWSPRRR